MPRALVPGFFSAAVEARAALEQHIGVEAASALPAGLCERFVAELTAWSQAHLGLGQVTRPTLDVYLGGRPPGPRPDAGTGRLAYELSLSPGDGFNQLRVGDEQGERSGHVLLSGHLASAGAIVEMAAGSEGFREAARHMVNSAGAEAQARLARLEPACQGLLTLRFRVDEEGGAVEPEVLHHGVRSVDGLPLPDGLSEAALEELGAVRFPTDLGVRSFTFPLVLGGPAPPPEPAVEATPPAPRLPDPAPAGTGPVRLAAGRPITVLAALASPRVVLLGGVLSDDECDELIARALPSIRPSRVVDPVEGFPVLHPERTSSHAALYSGADPFLLGLDRRFSELVDWPRERMEDLQVTHYLPGAQYRPHHDYFAPVHAGSSRPLAQGGNRVATLIIYLAVPEEGGATIFPHAGLDVMPVRGHAVFFSYAVPDPSTRTLHGGAPVVRGEKWIATKWFRAEALS